MFGPFVKWACWVLIFFGLGLVRLWIVNGLEYLDYFCFYYFLLFGPVNGLGLVMFRLGNLVLLIVCNLDIKFWVLLSLLGFLKGR